ncbi:hypothetical protein F6V25_05015 [Oryzomonas japonica]|uniref:Uncharacterized protein n=1 Tax=Oryzomonas japonica TaxID=2603858 RepID=A0A7J4ZTK6_9BACT|nr:hypothetical protein [Oryzomonas japonica]KAB0666778.1 hypothetical protein F6V25_05015 [Oryzomonas japonica]
MTFGMFYELLPASQPFFGLPFKIGKAQKMETIGRLKYNPFELSQIVTEHIRATPWSETNGDLS